MPSKALLTQTANEFETNAAFVTRTGFQDRLKVERIASVSRSPVMNGPKIPGQIMDPKRLNFPLTSKRNSMKTWIVAAAIALTANLACAIEENAADDLFQQIGKNDALNQLKLRADQGDMVAQDRIGLAYLSGHGVEKDLDVARIWLQKAADEGYALSQARLGFIYANGLGVKMDLAQAVSWYGKAGEQGNIAASYNLGAMYSAGGELQKDDILAAKWFRVAAEKGLAEAQLNLGVLYMGEPLGQDHAEALRWFSKAAEAGNAKAMLNLAGMYQSGRGVKHNDAAALAWLEKAAAAGDWMAMGAISNAYKDGTLGLKQDSEKAEEWYKKYIEAQLKR